MTAERYPSSMGGEEEKVNCPLLVLVHVRITETTWDKER
jgi:hypothetical protein